MNDGKIIIDKIIAEAEEVAKASLAKGQKEADAVLKAAQEKVNKELDVFDRNAQAEAEKAAAKEISGAQMQAKKAILETKQEILAETIAEDFDFEMIKTVHDRISEMVEEHKQSKEPEPLTMTKSEIEKVLEYSGADETHTQAFSEKFDEEFGKNTVLPPQNIVDVKKFELTTPDVLIKVNPERKDLVTTQIINGTKYIMIRAEENVEVNGININIK